MNPQYGDTILIPRKTILIMAGGTGGHIFPALAVAHCLRDDGWEVHWLGNPGSMEDRLVPPKGFTMHHMRFDALRGKGWGRKLRFPFQLFKGVTEALSVLRRVRPQIVLGMGAYVSFPGALAAKLLGIPLVIHEQNSVPGLSNRVLSFFANRILTGFPDAMKKSLWTGNPVREEIAAITLPEERYERREGALNVLVIGGSLGAQAFNETIPEGLSLIAPEKRPRIVHQSGEKHLEELKRRYDELGIEAHCAGFIEDMAGAYAWADIVICRAGALTIAELAAVGVPAILTPYPYAVDDHQTRNAHFLTKAGGGFLLPQDKLTPESVALIANYSRGQLLEMAKKSRAMAKPEAAKEVARICWEAAR